ncbi:MAG: penicillin acylase family protein [Ignavibacteriales bacterium]|nr:penicillin acylase family protein [Ignavibacteriales bacterium]
MKKSVLLLLLPLTLFGQGFSKEELSRWQKQASRVTIIRDTWGIPHIYGKSDADAVFGLLYAQCEDDFKRVEMNYIEKLGRTAEVKGEAALASDLYIQLVIDSSEAMADYKKSPGWLRTLMNAYADGINYYIFTHPSVKPALLKRFESWFPLMWTNGSISAISTGDVTARDVRALYLEGSDPISLNPTEPEEQLTGSNGFAIVPSKTLSGNAILYINPHVSFYFRPEVHVVSEEGLNTYGAVTWGQFFVYQGFNQHCGWMHTSSAVDVSDMYVEKVTKKDGHIFYKYNGSERPVTERTITLRYRVGDSLQAKTIRAYFTHHGPVMAKRNGEWISVRSYNRSLTSLIQSWQRTKSTGFASFKKTMALCSNTSDNTVFADDKGNIAYWHGNFVPRRDNSVNWAKPVDGTTPATEWKGLHTLDEIVHVYNPSNGWIQNCNSTPFTVSGASSPKRENFPVYMAPDGENFRGINAVRVLSREHAFTLDKIIAAGYDPTLTAFEILVPALVTAFEQNVKPNDSLFVQLNEAVTILKQWDFRCSENSIATTLAVDWGRELNPAIQRTRIDGGNSDQVEKTKKFAGGASVQELALPLLNAMRDLEKRFGKWQMPWGEINRYQRLTNDLEERFDDNQPSLPVGFASSQWGMLAAYNSRSFSGTNKRYGIGGASFVCAVEFGKNVRAKSVLTGGESGDPTSKHFTDQALMYTKGQFKDVLFYKQDVLKHVEKKYHPGEITP